MHSIAFPTLLPIQRLEQFKELFFVLIDLQITEVQ